MSGSRCYNEISDLNFFPSAILQKKLIVANSSTDLLFLGRMTFWDSMLELTGRKSVPSRVLNAEATLGSTNIPKYSINTKRFIDGVDKQIVYL